MAQPSSSHSSYASASAGPSRLHAKLAEMGLRPCPEEAGSQYTSREIRLMLQKQFVDSEDRMAQPGLEELQVHWRRKPDLKSMLPFKTLPQTTSLRFVRAGLDGHIIGSEEVVTHQPASSSVVARKTQLELRKQTATQRKGINFVRGRSGGTMFMPGGLDDDDDLTLEESQLEPRGIQAEVQKVEVAIMEWGRGLRSIPPGLQRGFKAGQDGEDDDGDAGGDEANLMTTAASQGLMAAPVYQPSLKPAATLTVSGAPKSSSSINNDTNELDELLPTEKPHMGTAVPSRSGRGRQDVEKREWAHVVDSSKRLANFDQLVLAPAHKFPFTLDPFQQEAVYHLEQGDSVFVAAHTSAGKTVVAEYAIALAQKHMTRCIYTSPIKALSNQKYRDFKTTFGADNVGILTGDVQINPEAPCLIMTTEILRSMLYRGADLIRDVEFVIFDEVHYVNDQERGVVWEEVIILCPRHISLILLSATVPNTREFADWVGRTKKKDIYVISTSKRPVPLEHFLYASKEIYKIVDSSSRFLESGIKEAGDALKRKQDKEREAAGVAQPVRQGARGGATGGANSRGGRGGQGVQRGGLVARGGTSAQRGRGGAASMAARSMGGDTKNLYVHLTGLLKKKDLLPVVVFVFSKRRCEEYASSIPNTDMCTAKEKSEVHIVIERSLMRLKGSDKKLPQIERMRDLLGRGVAVHHGGLLPIVKEIVEILFQRGLVKILFATETFAMGVNMPARSVVFSGIRKHDGHAFRELLAGEYTQMSGRAGRRGLDKTGVVIINAAEELPETAILHKLLLGQPTKLQSQFRLTYNMILNLLRVETLKVEEMIKRSFSENASQRLLPDQQKKVEEKRKKLDKLVRVQPTEREEALGRFHDTARAVEIASQGVLELAMEQQQGSKIFAPGRVVLLRDIHFENNPAVLVKQIASRAFLVLAAVSPQRKKGQHDLADEVQLTPRWPPIISTECLSGIEDSELVYDLREVSVQSLSLVTKHMIKLDQSMIMAHRISAMNKTVEAMRPILAELIKAGREAIKCQEVEWVKLRRLDFQEALKSRDDRAAKVAQVVEGEAFAREYRLVHARKNLEREIMRIEHSMSNQNLELLPDYEQRVDVLKTLRFIDPLTESVLLKGRVACEINSADELVLTELILDNVFATYSPAEIVALLSVFVFQEKTDCEPVLTERLQEGLATILSTSERVSQVQAEHQLNYQDYSVALKVGLVEVVYRWAEGTSFEEITQLTDVAEGTIVRVMTRLDQACLEVRDAARVIGDADLKAKMEEAQVMIRRDILAAPSLYF